MEHYVKYLIIFVSTINVLINCDEIDNVTFNENKNNRERKSAPNLSIPRVDGDLHATMTNIKSESLEGSQFSPAVKKSYNSKPIENESTEINKEIPIIWYKQWTPNGLQSGMLNNHMDLNEAFSYNDLPLLYSLNRVPSVSSLPPVYPVYLNNMIPYEKLMNYKVDGFNSPDLYMSDARAIRSRDEELLAQLSHDAVMQNILPTMPFPYFRRASFPYEIPEAQIHDAHVMAMFSNGKAIDSTVPLLFTCSAQITRGTIGEDPIYGNQFNSVPLAPVFEVENTDSGKEEQAASLDLAHIKGNADINSKKSIPIDKDLERSTVPPIRM